MQWTKVSSFSQLQSLVSEKDKYFIFFHKPGSPASDCAGRHLLAVEGDFPVYEVDATHVRDVHPHYGVTSVPVLAVISQGRVQNLIKGCQFTPFYEKILKGEGSGIKSADGKLQKRVTVYSTPSCPYCNKLKQYLNKHGVRYTDINVASNQQAAEEMVRKSGQRGVPQTDINGQMIIGFDVPKISRMLGIPTE